MVLLETWILITVEASFACEIGRELSAYGSDSQLGWQRALGVWNLLLACTSWYFIAVILVNGTFNAHVLPQGHTHPIIKHWPHPRGSEAHHQTNRNLNLKWVDDGVAKEGYGAGLEREIQE
jgi:hypothetical protein